MKTLNEPAPVLESTDRRKRFTEVCLPYADSRWGVHPPQKQV